MEGTLQHIRMGDGAIMDNTINMFFRSGTDVFKTSDNAFNLRPDNFYDFFTYFNSFSLKKWRKYTDIGKLFLEIDISGSFYIDLFGHYVDSNGVIQKEVLGKYYYNSFRRQTYTFEYPDDSMSEVVSFLIYVVKDDAKFYGGRYFTDSPTAKHMPVLTILPANTKNEIFTERLAGIKEKINECPELDERIVFSDNEDKAKKFLNKSDYCLSIDSNAFIEADCIKRIYTLLSYLKKEYKQSVFSAAMLNLNKRNIQFKYHGFTDIDLNNESSYERDLNIWDQVILNETEYDNKITKLTDSRCVCLPCILYGRKDLPLYTPNEEVSQKDDISKKIKNIDTITLNGVCFWFDENDIIAPKPGQPVYKKELQQKIKAENSLYDNKVILQDILLQDDSDTDEFIRLFYRSDNKVHMINSEIFPLQSGVWYDFSTYFNSFSLNKWKKYTHAENIFLELELSGSVYIELMGHYADGNGNIHKEWLGQYEYNCESKQKIVMPVPPDNNSDVIAFVIYARNNVRIYSGCYFTDVPDSIKKTPHISLVTTTYKKENFIAKNIELLDNRLFSDSNYKDCFDWFIIDNGNTLSAADINNSRIHLTGNRNVGGAGGFARGIMEANNYSVKPTHIILMDDDVLFSVDSFKRVYQMLSLLRDEYKDYFISGAMLEMEARHIQHEDIGRTTELGEHRPCKPRYDLSLWDSVIKNEVIIPPDKHQYAGWWFCCIPASIARNDNLPLPVFIRGDDIEYSHRNNAKFITMNGILIWHQGFTHKFSAALELYQVHRNDLILNALGRYASDVNIIARMKKLFWEEVYKFNYKGASLIADAIEDFLKGPEFIMNLKGDKYMSAKRARDNQLTDISPGIERMIDYDTLYEDEALTERQLNIYKKTHNGHLLPFTGFKNKVGIIPYGWGYWPGKQYLTNVNYAIDAHNHKYVKYTKSFSRFKAVTERFGRLIREYNQLKKALAEEYRQYSKEMSGEEFWGCYLM